MQAEESEEEDATSPLHLDTEMKMTPCGQEEPVQASPPPEQQQHFSPLATEDQGSPPRVKGCKANIKETDSETPPRAPASPPPSLHSAGKRPEEPKVLLQCLPIQHLPVDSDTDSAPEEDQGFGAVERLPEESNKRKAAEQRGADKKFCPSRRHEDTASPRTPAASPLRPERRSEERPRPVEDVQPTEAGLKGGTVKEPEPLPQEAPGPNPAEELEPQIGPEALVCHEVDLDDPDEKEKPASSAEHLLLGMREQRAAASLPPLLHAPHTSPPPQPQVRPFPPTAAPSSTPCPEELHPVRHAAEEEPEGDSSPGFDGSASSSTSLLSLQENKDRGKTTPGAACNTQAREL